MAQDKPEAAPKLAKAAPAATPDELVLADLARGILARAIRPRVADIRRLAEAVLATEEKRARKKAGGKKKRKLAKIPGQKVRK